MKKICCAYCGSMKNLTMDHIVPISRWKEVRINRKVLNNKSNLIVACRQCNEEKANLLIHEWFARHPEYKKSFKQNARYISDKIRSLVMC